MHKAGVKSEQPSGTAIPTPERLPHVQPPTLSSSPTNAPVFTQPFSTPPAPPSPGQSNAIPVPVPIPRSPRLSMSSGAAGSFASQTGSFGARRQSVGVAINPQPIPMSSSPPTTLCNPTPSSFPIQQASPGNYSFQSNGQPHAYTHVRSGSMAGLGSSPVRPSALSSAMRRDGQDEMAIED